MTHDDFDTLAAFDAVGAITRSDAALLDSHLGGCLPCRRAGDEYAEAATLLARGLAPVAPPRVLRAAIVESVAAAANHHEPRTPARTR